ncbi:hypothetical protein [Nocardia sp. NPDC051463]|uniref:hypothetical protein n=1 Tax=Nocardia sp. NPDC051463 TaxID=3154845 RepID=UPI003424098A
MPRTRSGFHVGELLEGNVRGLGVPPDRDTLVGDLLSARNPLARAQGELLAVEFHGE